MWNKILQLLCIYYITQNVFSEDNFVDTLTNDRNCDVQYQHNVNGKSFNAYYKIIFGPGGFQIFGSFSINFAKTEFTFEIQVNHLEYLKNARNDCKGSLKYWIYDQIDNVKKLIIVKLDSMENIILDFYAEYFPNVKELKLLYLIDNCGRLNKFFFKLKKIEKAELHYVIPNISCEYDNFINNSQLKEIYLIMYKPGYMYKYVVLEYFIEATSTGIRNIKKLRLTCPPMCFVPPWKLLSQLRNLTELILDGFSSIDINDTDFKDLTNLKSIWIINAYGDCLGLLRSDSLKKNLEYLYFQTKYLNNILPFGSELGILQSYQKLKIVNLTDSIYGTDLKMSIGQNLSAFICFQNKTTCIFGRDTNRHPCPEGCRCDLFHYKMILSISCDRFEALTHVPLPITGNTSLFLEGRHITNLPNSTLYGYSNVLELHLANNNISQITLDQLPTKLTYLDLRNNSLSALDQDVLQYLSSKPNIRIWLSGNPWNCSCDAHQLVEFISNLTNIIEDRREVRCSDDKFRPTMNLIKVDLCEVPIDTNYLWYPLGAAVTIIVVLVMLYLKKPVMMWLYERNHCLSCVSQPEPVFENVQEFDAFLAFAHQDLGLIEEYVDKLENGPHKHKLCFYQRDWQIGASIFECILKSIDNSKRIIILLTESFINSTWGTIEFQTAIRATSMNRNKRLIVVVYPDVKNFKKLDTELRLYLKFFTYLKRDDPLFWRKLLYSMPHTPLPSDEGVPLEIVLSEEAQA